MSHPSVEAADPVNFKVGKKHHILLIGRGFSEDDGAGGTRPIRVRLEDSTHHHDWDNADLAAAFISETHILVTSTPKTHAGDANRPHVPPHKGGGDLTVTVTNGDGGGSGPIRVPGVSYS